MSGINLSEIAVKYRSVTLFLILATIGAGVLAFLQLGRAEDPSFTIKVFTVSASWDGASAEEMQNQVADPLEKRLQELEYYDRAETTVRAGIMLMTVALVDATPPDQVEDQFYQARKKLSDEAPLLPQGVRGPFVNDEYSDVFFALYQLQAEGLPHHELIDEAERMRGLLLNVDGVRKVNIIGEQPQRIFIEISNERLATLGLGADAVVAAIAAQNLVVPAGQIETSSKSLRLLTSSAFDDLGAVRDTPLAIEGRSIRLGDIADVERGYQDPSTFKVRHNGAPAVTLGIVMRPGFNGLDLGENLSAQTDEIRADLPVGMMLTQITDQAYAIDKAYSEFMMKFVAALAVVMIVSFVSLGFRVGLVVAAAVPLTLAAVFVIMLITDRAFDRITLGALILSLGLLVDDAIIAIEMMVVKMEEGLDRVAAATYAWGATAAPMLTGTLVTVIGFLAIGFAPSSAGEYAGNIFWVVAFALLVSWIVAVYFTPYLGVKMLPDIKPVAGGHDAIYDSSNYRKLRNAIAASVRNRKLVVALVVGAFAVCTGLMATVVPQQFFPGSDRGEAIVEVYLPKGSSIEATTGVVTEIEGELAKLDEAQTIDSFIGAGAPRFFLSLDPELPDPSFAKILVATESDVTREVVLDHVDELVAQGRFPAARVRTARLLFGPPVKFPVTFRVSGPDIDVVREIADNVAAKMRDTPGTVAVNTDWGNRTPALRLEYNEDRLRQIGLTPTAASQQIGGFINGTIVSEARIGNRNVAVVLRSPEGPDFDPANLGNIAIRTQSGQSVSLSSVAKIVPTFEEPLLVRHDRVPTMTVRSDVTGDLQPAQVTAAVEPKLGDIRASLPDGYDIVTGGAVEESAKAQSALLPLFPIMLILMLTIIILQTRSFRLTSLVIATAPLGLIGAVPALLLSGKPFGFTAILGILGLAGIIMRNTLILTDQIEQEVKNGLSTADAVIEATVKRTRPVILTALAAILAFIPLSFSSFWGAMAVTLIGGTLMGTILTILFLPALYGLVFKVGKSEAHLDRSDTHRGQTYEEQPA